MSRRQRHKKLILGGLPCLALLSSSWMMPASAQEVLPAQSESPGQAQPIPLQPAPMPPQPLAQVSRRDSAQLVTRFNRAIALLIHSRFAEAKAEFYAIASLSVDAERRAASQEFARLLEEKMRTVPTDSSDLPTGVAAAKGKAIVDEEEGRASFLAVTTANGLNYGWMVPFILDVEDPKAFVGLYMLAAASSFAVPYLITRDDHITRGMSTLGGMGSLSGLAHGALAFGFIGGEDGADGEGGTRLMVASILAGSVLESTAGYYWAKSNETSPGQASSIALGTLWGFGYGYGIIGLATGEGTEFRPAMGAILAGSAAGTIAGYYYDKHRSPTEGDVGLVSYAGVIGALTGAVPLVIGEIDDPRAIVGTLLAGTSLGLFLGDSLTKDVDFGRGQSRVMMLGSLAGGLVGAGAGFLASTEDNSSKVVVTGSAIGAIGGFLAMTKLVEPESESNDSTLATAKIVPILNAEGQAGLGIAGAF